MTGTNINLAELYKLHSQILQRKLTKFEERLIRSAYYTGWSEASMKYSKDKTSAMGLTTYYGNPKNIKGVK